MSKYILFWEMDNTKIPEDPKARATAWNQLLGAVKKDLETGITKDWGAFIGENAGYSIVDGDELDIAMLMQQYIPYATFTTHPYLTASETEEMLRKLSG